MSRTARISPEETVQNLILISDATHAVERFNRRLIANLRSGFNGLRGDNPEGFVESMRHFGQRFWTDIQNRENLPTRFRQSLGPIISIAGLATFYAGMFSGEGFLFFAGMVPLQGGAAIFYTEVILDRQQRYNQRREGVAVANPNQIDPARFGLQPELLNQVLNCGVTSLLNDFSEEVIAALKTHPSASAQEAVALMNHLFTREPLTPSLDAGALAAVRDQKDRLMRRRLDYGSNFYADRQRHPITDPNLIQTLAYAHFVGALQKARTTNDTTNNLPEVDLTDLLQKYESFYERFSAHFQRAHGEAGHEFAQDYLRPILSEFARTGEDYNPRQAAQNVAAGAEVDIEAPPPPPPLANNPAPTVAIGPAGYQAVALGAPTEQRSNSRD